MSALSNYDDIISALGANALHYCFRTYGGSPRRTVSSAPIIDGYCENERLKLAMYLQLSDS